MVFLPENQTYTLFVFTQTKLHHHDEVVALSKARVDDIPILRTQSSQLANSLNLADVHAIQAVMEQRDTLYRQAILENSFFDKEYPEIARLLRRVTRSISSGRFSPNGQCPAVEPFSFTEPAFQGGAKGRLIVDVLTGVTYGQSRCPRRHQLCKVCKGERWARASRLATHLTKSNPRLRRAHKSFPRKSSTLQLRNDVGGGTVLERHGPSDMVSFESLNVQLFVVGLARCPHCKQDLGPFLS